MSSLQSVAAPATASAVPHFVIDLSKPPSERWREVTGAYCHLWPTLIQDFWQTVGDVDVHDANRTHQQFSQELADSVLSGLTRVGANDYASEYAAVASVSGVAVSDLLLLNLIYEMQCGCTAIAARVDHDDDTSGIVLGRTLDWEMAALKALTIDVSVCRNDAVLYRATTFAGYLGVLTAMRPGAYALAVNFRQDNASRNDVSDVTVFQWPVGLLVRHIMETCDNYQWAVDAAAAAPLMAPAYITIAAAYSHAVVITRNESGEVKRQTIAPRTQTTTQSSWTARMSRSSTLQRSASYLVQANMDHWLTSTRHDTMDSLRRTKLIKKETEVEQRKRRRTPRTTPIAITDMWVHLTRHPIWDDVTLYATVMSPHTNYYATITQPQTPA